MIDDGPSDLADELVRGETSPTYDGSPTEEDYDNWESWNPDPIDADSCKIVWLRLKAQLRLITKLAICKAKSRFPCKIFS